LVSPVAIDRKSGIPAGKRGWVEVRREIVDGEEGRYSSPPGAFVEQGEENRGGVGAVRSKGKAERKTPSDNRS